MSKKTFYDEKTKYYYITLPFNIVILAHLIRNTLPSITIILFHHTILIKWTIELIPFCEVRLHLGNKNKRLLVFHFVLRSVCTNFALRS